MSVNLPNINIPSSSLVLIGIGAIGFIVFVVLAQMSKTFLLWNYSGAKVGFFIGIFLTAIIGSLLVLKGGNLLRNLASWNQTPKVVKDALVSSGLVTNVLGSETQKVDASSVKEDFSSLNSEEKDSVKSYVCQ